MDQNQNQNQIFRQKSIERVSSPEALNDTIRVANPGVWLLLAAVILLLIGTCVWGIFGKLDTTVTAVVDVRGGNAVCYLSESDAKTVKEGLTFEINGKEMTVGNLSAVPICLEESVGGLAAGEYVYTFSSAAYLADGVYRVQIVTEQVSPISFVFN